MFRLRLLALLLVVTTALGAQTITWQPRQVQQASPILFTLTLDKPATRINATWLDKSVAFFSSEDRRTWYALAGPDVEQQPGEYTITLDGTYAGGAPLHASQNVQVTEGNFHSSTLKVAGKFIAPSAAQQRQIELDTKAKQRAWASSATQPLWSGDFILPVETEMFSNYGDNRIFNGKKVSIHRGTDFRAHMGTPVRSVNSGRVLLAQKLFLEGNCVIVDHGNQLFTIYMHFSAFRVKAGDRVKKGQVLGLSGATGRVTGPHLHLSVKWEGESLNPAALLAMKLPETTR
ncbi:M23 family metallopeptidase [Terriglobus tenax]|uniref:M23 family metallopeptidase n=1 Tax=Terriglobus tenax TaxID=1111115 RepID=UPI0021E0B30F|nr:M23 family metallopeptidase [Terriglobus tenax]